MSLSISEKEQGLLIWLKGKAQPVIIQEISPALELSEETVRSLIESLRGKQLITRIISSTKQIYQLTSEAQRFAINGLPEIRIVQFLAKHEGKVTLNTLEATSNLTATDRRLGLGWARRKNWVTVTKQRKETWLELARDAEKQASNHPLQIALQAATDQGKLEEEQLGRSPSSRKAVRQELLNRNLAEVHSYEIATISITAQGIEALQASLLKEDQIGNLTPELLKSGIWKERPFRPYNLRGPTPPLYPGKKNPYLEFIDRVKRILVGLGFQEAKGPLVELEFWNMDALFMPQDHVAREVHDIYHIKAPKGLGKLVYPKVVEQVGKTHEDGWKTGSSGWDYRYSFEIARRLVLRSQGTAVSVRFLAKYQKAPLRMFSIDRQFRPEKLDATHSVEFRQCEGIIGGEGLTLRDLLGYLRAIAEGVGIEKIKFKPGFFPFTEPSVEGFVFVPGIGWLEALPGGIFRPEVTQPLGIDFPVLAWGIGVDRLAMAALGIHDIRELATRDLDRLRRTSLRF